MNCLPPFAFLACLPLLSLAAPENPLAPGTSEIGVHNETTGTLRIDATNATPDELAQAIAHAEGRRKYRAFPVNIASTALNRLFKEVIWGGAESDKNAEEGHGSGSELHPAASAGAAVSQPPNETQLADDVTLISVAGIVNPSQLITLVQRFPAGAVNPPLKGAAKESFAISAIAGRAHTVDIKLTGNLNGHSQVLDLTVFPGQCVFVSVADGRAATPPHLFLVCPEDLD